MTPMQPEQAALWETIRENPHDDAPRLIYADWLEEHDDPDRAEFIRRQIDDARMEALGQIDDAFVENRMAARQLHQNHRREWWTPLHTFLDETRFERGFPSPQFDSRHFRSFIQLARYYQWTIPEWRLVMESGVNRLLEYASQPCFRKAVSLELISDIPNPAILKPYLNAPNLLNIWSLTLGMDRIRTGHLEVLIDSPLPDQLREFAIAKESSINFSHLRGAMRNTLFPHLHTLGLADQQITADVLREIDALVPLRSLRSLNLQRNMIGPDGITCLTAVNKSNLQFLHLPANRLDDSAAVLLANSPALAGLRYLDLSDNQIGVEGLRAILASPYLKDSACCIVHGNPGRDDPKIAAKFHEWQQNASGKL